MKEKFKKLGEQVVKNKGKIAFVGGVAAVGFVGFKAYKIIQNVDGMEKTIIEGAKGSYELYNFRNAGQMVAGDGWCMVSDVGTLQPEVIIDALRNTFGLVDI